MDQGNHDVSNVQYYMRGVGFPAEKEEVASTAESNGAPQDMGAQIWALRSGTRTPNASTAPRRSCKRSKAASTLGE